MVQFVQQSLVQMFFTPFPVDNIDHKFSSCSAKCSWHGRAISSTQHLESKTDELKDCYVQLVKHCFKGFTASPKGIQIGHPSALKSTDVSAPHLFKKTDLVPLGISLI